MDKAAFKIAQPSLYFMKLYQIFPGWAPGPHVVPYGMNGHVCERVRTKPVRKTEWSMCGPAAHLIDKHNTAQSYDQQRRWLHIILSDSVGDCSAAQPSSKYVGAAMHS